jgi:minor curlin subunit
MNQRIKHIVLTVAGTLLFNGGAFAGNTAVVNQSGGGSATVFQSGKSNTARIVQRGQPAVSKKAENRKQKGNQSLISQSGDHNVAHQTQIGEDNIGLVDQKGESNTVTQEQAGKHNLAAAVQEGIDNKILHSQDGAGHMHTIMEIGEDRSVVVSQSGSDQ